MIIMALIFAAGIVVGLLAAWLKSEYRDSRMVPYYDIEEIHEGCTVQVLMNSKTGDSSIGWWRGEKEDIPIIYTK